MSIHKKIKAHIKHHLEKRHRHHHMDNQTPGTNQKFLFGKIRVAYIFLFVAILLIIGLGVYFYTTRVQTSKKQPIVQDTTTQYERALKNVVTNKSQFEDDQKMAQIGEETVYGSDLNYILFTYFYSDYASPSASLNQLSDKLLAKAQEQSIILQEARKADFITLSTETFNSPNKSIFARSPLIATAEAKLRENTVSRINGESISIWFNNGSWPEPKMGYEAAKKVAREKIEALYTDLKSGKITFTQAADKILKDTSVATIDPAYKINTYYSWINRDTTSPIFNDPTINKLAWQLKEGETSNILTVNDFDKDNQPYEALFKVIKINKKVENGFGNFNDWLTAKRKQYEIKLF